MNIYKIPANPWNWGTQKVAGEVIHLPMVTRTNRVNLSNRNTGSNKNQTGVESSFYLKKKKNSLVIL